MKFECVNRQCNYWKEEQEGHCPSGAVYSKQCSINFIREKQSIYSIKYYLYVKNSDVCICGRKKQKGKTFCQECRGKLPRYVVANLGCRIGDGYEQAYDQAITFFQEI